MTKLVDDPVVEVAEGAAEDEGEGDAGDRQGRGRRATIMNGDDDGGYDRRSRSGDCASADGVGVGVVGEQREGGAGVEDVRDAEDAGDDGDGAGRSRTCCDDPGTW